MTEGPTTGWRTEAENIARREDGIARAILIFKQLDVPMLELIVGLA